MGIRDHFSRKRSSEPEPPPSPCEEAASRSLVVGWIIVLLNDSPPTEPAAFAEWARGLGLEAAGIRVDTAGPLRLGAGKHDALAYVGNGPFPRKRLDAVEAPASFDPGRGFIGLSLGFPGEIPSLRASDPSYEPWAANGPLRDISRIALELSKHGPGVVLPQSGTLLDAETFRWRLGHLDDPSLRHFGAWVGVGMDRQRGIYSSTGMVLQAQPDVQIRVDVGDDWEQDRACEAILVACSAMVHSRRALKAGDRLDVPVGQPVGGEPVVPIEGDSEHYVVEDAPEDSDVVMGLDLRTRTWLCGAIRLRRTEPAGARGLWAKEPPNGLPRVAFNTYRALLKRAMAAYLGARWSSKLVPQMKSSVPEFQYHLDLWEAGSGKGCFLTSNGAGRQPQGSLQRTDAAYRVELVAAMEEHHPVTAKAIATVALQVLWQKKTSVPIEPGNVVGLPVPEIGAAGLFVNDLGLLTIARGPPIRLLELIPLTQAECDEVLELGSDSLLERIGAMSPASRAERWKVRPA